jgi:hypothetical protein
MQSTTVKGSLKLNSAENLRLLIHGRVNLRWARIHTDLHLGPTVVLEEASPFDLAEESGQALRLFLSKEYAGKKGAAMQRFFKAVNANLFARLAVDLEHAMIAGKLQVSLIQQFRNAEGKLTSDAPGERGWADLSSSSIGELSDSYGFGWARFGWN